MTVRRFVLPAVRVVLTIAILGYLLRNIDWLIAREALRRFTTEAELEFVLLIAADRLLMFARWMFLIQMTASVGVRELARIFFVSSFVGSFLPAGVGGDAARAIQLTRQTNRPSAAIASVILDRLLGLQAVAVAGCAGVLLAGASVSPTLRDATLVLSITLIVASIAALYAEVLARPLRRHGIKVTSAVFTLAEDLALYRRHPSLVAKVAGLSMAVQAVRIMLAWVIGSSLGLDLPMRSYWVFMPLNILITLLPVSVGGFGVPQGAMVWSLAPFGVSATQAFLLSTIFILAGVVGNIPGAILYIAGSRSSESPQHGRSE